VPAKRHALLDGELDRDDRALRFREDVAAGFGGVVARAVKSPSAMARAKDTISVEYFLMLEIPFRDLLASVQFGSNSGTSL